MSDLIPFQFENKNLRVIADEHGEPLFVGKDICLALGYANHNDAMKLHCRGVVKRYPIVDALGRTQAARVLTEADMFRLVVNSTLPSAEAFERLVFEEILPTIRKTGAYIPPQQTARLPQLQPVRDLLLVGKAMAKVKGVNEALAMACTLDAIERTTGLPTTMLARALPTVAPESAATLNATQVGEPLSLNGRSANAILEKMGLQYRDENKNWKLTEAGTAYGEMKPFHRNGHSGYETRWKPSAIEVLRNYLDTMAKSA